MFLGIAAALVAGELAARFIPGCGFEEMALSNLLTGAANWKRQYRRSPELGYELVPNAVPGINSFGMRDKEYSLKKSAGVFRILLLGDSITEEGKWSEYVEDALNAAHGGKYELLNAAVRGWNIWPYWAYVTKKSRKFEPDMIMLGLCLNDMDGGAYAPTILYNSRDASVSFFCVQAGGKAIPELTMKVSPYLYVHSYLYRSLVKMLNSKRFSSAGEDISKYEPVNMMSDIVRMYPGRVLAVVFPYLKPLREYTPFERMRYDKTIEVLRECSVPYLDLTPHFNSYGKRIIEFRDRPDDPVHFNDEANRIKAGIIQRWLSIELEKMRNSRT